jgi:hypothetical protein
MAPSILYQASTLIWNVLSGGVNLKCLNALGPAPGEQATSRHSTLDRFFRNFLLKRDVRSETFNYVRPRTFLGLLALSALCRSLPHLGALLHFRIQHVSALVSIHIYCRKAESELFLV